MGGSRQPRGVMMYFRDTLHAKTISSQGPWVY